MNALPGHRATSFNGILDLVLLEQLKLNSRFWSSCYELIEHWPNRPFLTLLNISAFPPPGNWIFICVQVNPLNNFRKCTYSPEVKFNLCDTVKSARKLYEISIFRAHPSDTRLINRCIIIRRSPLTTDACCNVPCNRSQEGQVAGMGFPCSFWLHIMKRIAAWRYYV